VTCPATIQYERTFPFRHAVQHRCSPSAAKNQQPDTNTSPRPSHRGKKIPPTARWRMERHFSRHNTAPFPLRLFRVRSHLWQTFWVLRASVTSTVFASCVSCSSAPPSPKSFFSHPRALCTEQQRTPGGLYTDNRTFRYCRVVHTFITHHPRHARDSSSRRVPPEPRHHHRQR
jgi:hypothetical protein